MPYKPFIDSRVKEKQRQIADLKRKAKQALKTKEATDGLQSKGKDVVSRGAEGQK